MAANIAVFYDARLKNLPQTYDNHLETLANQDLLTSVAMLRDLRSES